MRPRRLNENRDDYAARCQIERRRPIHAARWRRLGRLLLVAAVAELVVVALAWSLL